MIGYIAATVNTTIAGYIYAVAQDDPNVIVRLVGMIAVTVILTASTFLWTYADECREREQKH